MPGIVLDPQCVSHPHTAMTDQPDIEIDISEVSEPTFADALGASCSGTTLWSRDGILEHQVSTQEEVQLCFRNEPGGDRPRAALCLAGTEETLTVAAVVPIDRGIELSDDQYAELVREYYREILEPAVEGMEVVAELEMPS